MRSIPGAMRPAATAVAVLALAFVVAAAVKRQPPDFAHLVPIAVIRDSAQRPLWAIRLAGAAHEIAADALGGPPPPGRAYQLWLAIPSGAHSLGLLPAQGRKIIPEIPALAARLAGPGELLVSLEAARGSRLAKPSGPILFRTASDGLAAPVAR
jgi:anti-sigma-K factor RskA